MKKILGLGVALVLIISTLSVGTFAYFNDVTTVSSNAVTAGTLTLTVGGGSPVAISLADRKPTHEGTAGSWSIVAGGSINGSLNMTFGAITNNENTRSALETSSGDTTAGATDGELGGLCKMLVFLDADADGKLDDGEKYLKASDGSVASFAGGDDSVLISTDADVLAAMYTIDSFGTDAFTNIKTNFTGAGETVIAYYYFPHDATKTGKFYNDNRAQSDGVSFDIDFELVQYVAP